MDPLKSRSYAPLLAPVPVIPVLMRASTRLGLQS